MDQHATIRTELRIGQATAPAKDSCGTSTGPPLEPQPGLAAFPGQPSSATAGDTDSTPASLQPTVKSDYLSRSSSMLAAAAQSMHIQLDSLAIISQPVSPSDRSQTPISFQLDMSPLQPPAEHRGGLAWPQVESMQSSLHNNSSRDTLTLTSTAPSSLVASSAPSRRESLRGKGDEGVQDNTDSAGNMPSANPGTGSKVAQMRSLWEQRLSQSGTNSSTKTPSTRGAGYSSTTRYRQSSSRNRCSSDDVQHRLRRLRVHEEKNSKLTSRLMARLQEISLQHNLDFESPSGSSAASVISEMSPLDEATEFSPNTQLYRGLDRSLASQYGEFRRITRAALRVVSLEHIFRSGNATCDVAVSTENMASSRVLDAVDAIAAAAARCKESNLPSCASAVAAQMLLELQHGDDGGDSGANAPPSGTVGVNGALSHVQALANITNLGAWPKFQSDEELKRLVPTGAGQPRVSANAPPPTLKPRRRSDDEALRAALAVDGACDISEILSASWSTIAATSTTATPRLESELEESAESSFATPQNSVRASWQAPATTPGDTAEQQLRDAGKGIARRDPVDVEQQRPRLAGPDALWDSDERSFPSDTPRPGSAADVGASNELRRRSSTSSRLSEACTDSASESGDSSLSQEVLVLQGAHGMNHEETKLYELEQAELQKIVEIQVPEGVRPDRRIMVKFEGRDYDYVLPEGLQIGQRYRIPLYRKPPLEVNQAQAVCRGHANWDDRASIFSRLMQRTNVPWTECSLEDPSSWDRAACRVDDRESRSRQSMYRLLRGLSLNPLLQALEEEDDLRSDSSSFELRPEER